MRTPAKPEPYDQPDYREFKKGQKKMVVRYRNSFRRSPSRNRSRVR